MKSGAESASVSRAWQALGAVVQHTSDNMLRSLVVIYPFVAAKPVLYIVAISLDCVHIQSFWLIWLCTYRAILTRARFRVEVNKAALRRVLKSRDVSQVVSRRPLTAVAWVLFQTSPCGICCRQNGTGTPFSPNTRVETLIVATIYLQLIQNRYMFRSSTVLQCSHQHCVQPVASDVEIVGYL